MTSLNASVDNIALVPVRDGCLRQWLDAVGDGNARGLLLVVVVWPLLLLMLPLLDAIMFAT